jgi:hypothetical protein
VAALPPINPVYRALHDFAPPPPEPLLLDWIVTSYIPVLTLLAIIALAFYTFSGGREANYRR